MFVSFKKPIVSIIILSGLMFLSCGSSKMVFGNGGKWLPENMDLNGTVLLICPFGSKGTMRKVEEFMQDNYPYKYKICPNDSLAFLNDTKTYRYMLMPTWQSVNIPSSTGLNNNISYNNSVSAHDFYFVDRMENKKYPQTYKGSYSSMITFRPLIRTVVKQYQQKR